MQKKTKLKIAEFLSNEDSRRKQYEQKSFSKKQLKVNFLWVIRFNLTPEKLTLLWPEWKAKIFQALKDTQKTWFLPQINHSPTNHSAEEETIRRLLEFVAESQKSSISVTYELAIAKVAMQI